MRRREFITLLGGAAAVWPFTVLAQQSGLPVIGFLSSRSPGESEALVSAFHLGLGETGYIAGKRSNTVGQKVTMTDYQFLPPNW